MQDEQFKLRVKQWRKDFAEIGESMSNTTDKQDRYPQIDFNPLQFEFEKIVAALAMSREPDLIHTPATQGLVDAQGNGI